MSQMVSTETPQAVGLVGHRWTLKKLVTWVFLTYRKKVSRNAVRNRLLKAGLSWKKCKKLLLKAKSDQRTLYMEQLHALYEQMCQGKAVIIYIDQTHFHQDLDLGYSWSPKGKPHWIASTSPGLKAKINWYGAYDFTRGRCCIWQNGRCNGDNTIAFLQHLAHWLAGETQPIYIILDGAPWHRSKKVAVAASQLGLQLVRLPGYSPDLNPIEGLWKWMREEVTQLFCHPDLASLSKACYSFISQINLEPDGLIRRLWPKFDLDPEFEKLLVSK